jgi:hypothetical protein
MKEAQNSKKALLLPPQLKDNGDFANNTYVDTAGWGYAEFLLAVGDTDVAAGDAIGSTAEGTAPYIEECDTTGGAYTKVTGAELADSIQYNEDNKLFQIDVDLADKAHKRYMRVNAPHSAAGAANGSNLAITCTLSKPEKGPANAAGRGLAEHIIA